MYLLPDRMLAVNWLNDCLIEVAWLLLQFLLPRIFFASPYTLISYFQKDFLRITKLPYVFTIISSLSLFLLNCSIVRSTTKVKREKREQVEKPRASIIGPKLFRSIQA